VWFEPYIDTYDQRGQLWRTHIYWLAYRDRPVPDAFIAIYPFKREFVSRRCTIDTQGGFSTIWPEHECWYINQGGVGKDFFTVRAMEAASQAR
jgi:hypothetical protein